LLVLDRLQANGQAPVCLADRQAPERGGGATRPVRAAGAPLVQVGLHLVRAGSRWLWAGATSL
jgi:hypothetical protein